LAQASIVPMAGAAEKMAAPKDIYADRRQYEGGDDGEGRKDDPAENPASYDREKLIKRAKVHMQATGCTEWDDTNHCYRQFPVVATTRDTLGMYGLGVTLYFDFLVGMGILFLALAVLSLPLFVTAVAWGDMITSDSTMNKVFGSMTVGNLGTLRPGDIPSPDTIQERYISLTSDVQLKDLAAWIGTLDGVGLLIFMGFGVWYQKFWIKRQAKKQNKLQITPSDFAVQIHCIPRRLKDPEEHKKYETLLKEHFEKVLLKHNEDYLKDSHLIEEVSLAREHNGRIKLRMDQGQQVLEKDNLELQQKLNPKLDLAKKITKKVKSIEAYHKRLGKDAEVANEDRDVCTAFVTFKNEKYKRAVMYEYRFALSGLFRCCQSEHLRFQGSKIMVVNAPEPSDLAWENIDYDSWKHLARRVVTTLLTLLIAIVCLIFMVAAKSATAPKASLPSAEVWVMQGGWETVGYTPATCFDACSLSYYKLGGCTTSITTGEINRYFDANGTLSTLACSDRWESQACTAGDRSPSNWVAVEFTSKQTLTGLEFIQSVVNSQATVKLWACTKGAVPTDATALKTWKPEENCLGVLDLKPAAGLPSALNAPSGCMTVSADTSCTGNITLSVATEARDTAAAIFMDEDGLDSQSALDKAVGQDSTVSCYCTKQSAIVGYSTFLSPPFDDTPEKKFCEAWIYTQARMVAMLVLGVLAVCILNQVLVFICQMFVVWERHHELTAFRTSQLWKLFLSQFLNTGLLVLLVNGKWHGQTDNWPIVGGIMQELRFGDGVYDEFEQGWFTTVGASICLTMLLQVLSVTTPAVVMSKVVNPLMIKFFTRSRFTQKMINQVYVMPEWQLALRQAQTVTMIFCLIMYGGGMPVLYMIGVVYCGVAYWLDKWVLLRGSLRPPAYDGQIMVMSLHLFPVAALLHSVLTLWMYGNQTLLPSKWGPLAGFYGGLIGVSEERYDELMNTWTSASEPEKRAKGLFDEYVHARGRDMARWSCWLLLIIFLVFLVYYIVYWVIKLFLLPFVKSCLIAIQGKIDERNEKKQPDEGQEWADGKKKMLESNMLTSYRLDQNPDYAILANSMVVTEEELKKSLAAAEALEKQKEEEKAKPPQAAKDEESASV